MQANYLDRIGSEEARKSEPCPMCALCPEVAKRIQLEAPTWTTYAEFQECVSVYPGKTDGLTFWWGTANETWGCDVYFNGKAQEDGIIATSLDTGITEDERDAGVIARAIVRTVKRYVAAQAFSEALSDFKCSAYELLEAWEHLDPEDRDSGKLIEDYPFKESFDEECAQIQNWQEEVDNDPAFGKTYLKRRAS